MRVGKGLDPIGQRMEKAVGMVWAGSRMQLKGGRVGCW